MTESTSGPPHPPEPATDPAADPTTVIGLIFRVLNQPSRTLCLLAILALTLAGIGHLLHAPPIAHLPVGMWGMAISGGSITSIGAGKLIRSLRSKRQGPIEPSG